MKLVEITKDEYPLAYILIQNLLAKEAIIKFHSEGTYGKIIRIVPYHYQDGFEMFFAKTDAQGNLKKMFGNESTIVRVSELDDAELTQTEDGWHLELPLYDGGQAQRMQQTFKDKNRKNQP